MPTCSAGADADSAKTSIDQLRATPQTIPACCKSVDVRKCELNGQQRIQELHVRRAVLPVHLSDASPAAGSFDPITRMMDDSR
ncbi:Uncharacterized protein APZ42_017300 [Daphnia magna]|uniref:Uncharacterized protein n=1 Tax=Daphnia magna TaxID=35525 RepID=A0A164ZSN5_9CRUS|nr:Uncharacterized protein APZ42_017300 [Daphnia magna]